MFRILVALVALSIAPALRSAAGAGVGRRPAATPGCYRADHPLGEDAGSIRRPVTPGRLTTFRLLDGGRVDRPGIFGASSWAPRSRWERAGDTLRVRLSTGTAGWALRLVATPAGSDSLFAGEARYLSDAIVPDAKAGDTAWWRAPQPVARVVRVWREPCA